MKPLRRWNKDRVSAGLLALLGAGIIAQGLVYRMGSLTRMGAGFIPVVLGVLLILIGAAIGLTAEPKDFGTAEKDPTEWRGWLCIVGGVVAFVVVGGPGGLVPATFLAVFISAMGDRGNRWRDAALLALAITVAGVLIFHTGLKMPFHLFPWD